ncbi:MAG: hypothetical protein GY834_02845 [Bacteroidetes bacterium]|nr:hypothetical protein [Bacteroidota bacterium]
MAKKISLNQELDKDSNHYRIAKKLVDSANYYNIEGDIYFLIIYIYHEHKDRFRSFTAGFHSRIIKNGNYLTQPTVMKFITGQNLNKKHSLDEIDITDDELKNWNEFVQYLTDDILTDNECIIRGKRIFNNPNISFNLTLIEKIKILIGDNFSSNTPILDYFSKEYAINKDSVSQFLLAFPEVFFHYLNEKHNSEIMVSDLIDFSKNSFITGNEKNGLPQFKKDKQNLEGYEYKDLNDFDSFYFGQSQNPNVEQLSLILEYGKILRVAKMFDKKLNIVFSNIEWSKLNKVYKDIQDGDLGEYNFNFRKKVLENIKIDHTDKSEIKYVIRDYAKKIDINDYEDEEAFRTECRFLYSLYLFLKKNDFYGGIDNVKIPDSDKIFNRPNTRDFKTGISKMADNERIIIHPIYSKFPLEVIKIVVEHFKNNIDKNTFFYILIQKMAQFTFENDLKLGVRSEYVFDKSFVKWDNLMEQFHKEDVKMQRTSIYYNHYYFGDNKDKYALPYYWPSGELKNDKNAKDKILLLNDDDDKISRLINSTPISQILIQLTDLISFLFEFEINTEETDEIIQILNNFNRKMGADYAKRKKTSFKDKIQSSQFITPFFGLYEFPFFYYPYLMHFTNEDTEKDIKLFYIELIKFTLKLLNYKPF